jgi:hypothetical protein
MHLLDLQLQRPLALCGRPLHLYRGTSLVRNRRTLVPYCKTMPRALWKGLSLVRT